MPILALKAQFVVTAGVIPGQPMAEYAKVWKYTSEHHEKDRSIPEHELETTTTTFQQILKEMHDYAQNITQPAYVNWVKTDFMWF